MKQIIAFLLLINVAANGQDITGIWRGYFLQKTFDLRTGQFVEERYKYEVQLNNLPNNSIQGVTYSYKTTLFYGKASAQGIFTKKTRNLLLKENKMLEVKISDQSVACLMTCYLDYEKSADKQTLTGTYTSANTQNGVECGSGTVYLEKVKNTEFEKEDFLVKKEAQQLRKSKLESINKTKKDNKSEIVNNNFVLDTIKRNTVRPGAEDFVVPGNTKKIKDAAALVDTKKPKKLAPIIDSAINEIVPEVLQKRENIVSNTLEVDAEDVTIEFYDNGQIDGDTISVYHDNRIIIDKKRLGYSPITMNVHVDEKNPVYEFIAVAENLGAVPPNTALLIISSGSKHYEINITSDEQRNAKIILNYKKPPEKTN